MEYIIKENFTRYHKDFAKEYKKGEVVNLPDESIEKEKQIEQLTNANLIEKK